MTPAAAHEVVADMGRALGERLTGGRLSRNLHRLQRDTDLCLAGGLGQFLDRLPLAIATEKVHSAIGA